jgi:hypothetical protein
MEVPKTESQEKHWIDNEVKEITLHGKVWKDTVNRMKGQAAEENME